MLNREVLDANLGFPSSSEIKNLPASAGASGDRSLINRSGRSPGGGNGNPLQYSCLESPMDRGTWQAIVHGTAKMLAYLTVAFKGKGYNIIESSMVSEVGFYVHLFFPEIFIRIGNFPLYF